ncbi:MAG: caspase family protein [Acidobacteria bacterium]|nr:caspase family protein [Acidobacteriota bacterium]MCA1627057.1 caspase family protein [Acidobacteriota bacterium]
MPPPFREISIQDFADLLEDFPFSRTINSVHMHHTWRPRHADYRGRTTIEGMWRYHTKVNGWSDIAQHITIAPDGVIWTGRGWNEPPASAAGQNGTRRTGPFMFEMIGDFDRRRDPFRAPQLDVAVEVIARVQSKFNLPMESLRFHNQLSSKTCPGDSIEYETILAAVRELRDDLARQPLRPRAAGVESPFPEGARGFGEEARSVLIELLSGDATRTSDPPDAEPAEDMPPVETEAPRGAGYSLEEIRARSAARGRSGLYAGGDVWQNRTYARSTNPGGSQASSGRGGRKRALCVGINTYPTAPLFGCVNDARSWANALERLGFDVSLLLDGQASRDAILKSLSDLVRSGNEGDVLVFQYSGHGTNVTNENGDEEIDKRDEALCPHDFATGALVIDDDVAEIFASLRDGVNLTNFMDCCFSETNTRLGVGPLPRARWDGDSRPRLVPPSPQLDQAHIEFRRRFGARSFTGRLERGIMRNASFAACLDRELAWESGGQGDFTRIAVPLLRHVEQGITNAEFARRVETDFGPNPRQHPRLDAQLLLRDQLLLQPSTRTANIGSQGNGKPAPDFSSVAQALRAFASLIENQGT